MSLRNNYNEQHVKLVGNLKRNEDVRASVGSQKSVGVSESGEDKKGKVTKVDDNKNILNLRNPIGSKARGIINSINTDDRTARVTLVRRMQFATPPE